VQADVLDRELTATTTAMASRIDVRLVVAGGHEHDDAAATQQSLDEAMAVFHTVDRTCTRFDPHSDLMRANADPDQWHRVDRTCFDALVAAFAAYRRTHGRFDPRVLDDLVRLGYDRSMRLGPPTPRGPEALLPRAPLPVWEPRFRRETGEVWLGPHPVDLGGIGKGLAVRWAAQRLAGVGRGHLVTAGGDCHAGGSAADGGAWRVAVERPDDPEDPVAVLALRDLAVATSSVRIRQWQVDGRPVHHLLDPSTGQPGGEGLAAVTVVDEDAADAETWSKVLFLTGVRGVATTAAHFGIPALWVHADGTVAMSAAMQRHVVWTAA
jgi:thiamine biosynthesis lipoprotein